jgi:acyl-CoA thioesterase-1
LIFGILSWYYGKKLVADYVVLKPERNKMPETGKTRNMFVWFFFIAPFVLCTGRNAPAVYAADNTDPNDIIICLGDSITLGVAEGNWNGEDQEKSWPGILRERINIPVINAGVQGETTTQALYRLYRDVLSKNPRAVIITLGVNDFLQSFDVWVTEHNFNILLSNLGGGNRKIFVAKFFTNSILRQKMNEWQFPSDIRDEIIARYDYMYAALAQKYGVEIISDIWEGVWGVRMTDDVHPSVKGYEIMADHYFAALRPWLEVNGLLR